MASKQIKQSSQRAIKLYYIAGFLVRGSQNLIISLLLKKIKNKKKRYLKIVYYKQLK